MVYHFAIHTQIDYSKLGIKMERPPVFGRYFQQAENLPDTFEEDHFRSHNWSKISQRLWFRTRILNVVCKMLKSEPSYDVLTLAFVPLSNADPMRIVFSPDEMKDSDSNSFMWSSQILCSRLHRRSICNYLSRIELWCLFFGPHLTTPHHSNTSFQLRV